MEGTISLFGFPSTSARIQVLPRSTSWRAFRASGFLRGGLILAPVVALIPPHVPWALAVLGVGGFIGMRKWKERFRVLGLEHDTRLTTIPASSGREAIGPP